MIVEAKETRSYSMSNDYLTKGSKYFVYFIMFFNPPVEKEWRKDQFVEYIIMDDTGGITPFSSDNFDIIDNTVPEDWVFTGHQKSCVHPVDGTCLDCKFILGPKVISEDLKFTLNLILSEPEEVYYFKKNILKASE